jgi:hypothetical protein
MEARKNEAEESARDIAAELLTLEAVLDGRWAKLLDDDYSDLEHDEQRAVDRAVELCEEMAEQAGEEMGDYSPSIVHYLNRYGLDYLLTGKNRGEGWELTGGKMLRSFGGPNVWITWGLDDDDVVVDAYWSGDHDARHAYAPTVVEQLTELAKVDA